MKKKVLTTTIATGLMAAGVLTTQNPASAKADTVPTGDNATSTNEVATQKSDAKTIAQNNVNTAQNNLDKAKADTQNASDSLQQAKANETTAQKAVDEQTNKVADAQSNVDKAQADVTTAQNNVNAAQKTVDDAKAAMDPANVQSTVDAANKAEAQVNQDKQDVATAQTNLENAKAADATRQTNIDNAKKAVNTAQANVDFSTKQAQEMKDQLNKYQGIKDTAQKEVDGLNDKLSNVNTIELPKGYTKEAYRAWNEANYKKYIGTATAEDLQAIKNWEDITSQEVNNNYKHNKIDEDNKILNGDIHNLTQSQLEELATFTASLLNPLRKQVGSIPLEVSKGSVKIAQDVAKKYEQDNWTAWGNVKDSTFKGHDINGLVEVANKYNFQDIGENLGGNALMYGSDNMDQLKEYTYVILVDMLLHDGDSNWGHARAALGLLNNADSYGGDDEQVDHAYIGVSFDNIPGALMGSQEHFNFMYTPYGYVLNEDNTARISTNDKFDATPVAILSTEDLVTQLNTAKAKLASATDALNKAKDADTQAQQILAKNKVELTTAQDNLTKAQNVLVQTEIAQKALTDVQNKLAADTKINEDAQAKKEAALGDEAAKQKVLDQANANLATAQKALTDAQAKQKAAENNLSAEKAKLASLQQVANEKIQDVKAAQVALDDAKNKLAALENAPLLVKAAEDKLAAAQKALDPVENVLVSEKAKLSALKQDLADAQADVTTAQKNYDEKLDNAKKVLQAIYDREALEAQIAAQEKAREEAEKKAAEEKAQAEKNGYHVDGNKVVDENGNQVSNWTVKNGQIIDNKGKVVSGLTINKAGAVVNKTGQQINSKNVVDNLQANKRTQAPVVQSKVAGKTYVSTVVVPEKAKANALPQTGEKESKTTLVGAILVGLGSLVGLFGLGRKKEY